MLPLEKVAASHHHATKQSTKEMTKEETLSQEQKESLFLRLYSGNPSKSIMEDSTF